MSEQTQYKLEYKLLFSMVVAGKSATFAEGAMKKFLDSYNLPEAPPLEIVGRMYLDGVLGAALRNAKTGNYTKLEKAFVEAAERVLNGSLDLRVCTPSQLEEIPGIGPKTSRFFILWTRPDARVAALDTHILKWLRYLGYKAPKSTPTGKKYEELELAFLAEADKRKMKPAALDTMIWEWCRDGSHKTHGWPPELQQINDAKIQ